MKLLTFIGMMVCWAGVQAQGSMAEIRTELQRIILNDTEISLQDTPGFHVTIVDGEAVYDFAFGHTTKEGSDSLTISDVFEVGSLSKTFTASLVSLMVEEGQLQYSDLVNSFLPLEYQNPRLDDITVLDLVQHTSSLPVKPHFFGQKNTEPDDPYKHYEKTDLLQFYSEYVPSKDEVGMFRYAHTNYALLEVIVEQIADRDYDSLLRDYLFSPLQMDQSFVYFKEDRDSILTIGYDRASRPAQPWSFASFAGSEGVKSTAADLTKFVKAHLGLADSSRWTALASNCLPEIPTNFNDYIYTGRGWQVIKRRKRYNIITQTGKTGGHNASVCFIKETNTAVIVLANSSIGTENLAMLILRMINRNWKRKTP